MCDKKFKKYLINNFKIKKLYLLYLKMYKNCVC